MNQINFHFDGEVTPDGLRVIDRYAESETRLGVDYARYGITQEIADAYLRSLCSHVFNVRSAGHKLDVDVRQLKEHDTSKFTLEEFPHYARNFHGDKANPDGFARAWLHHIHYGGEHHWQHFIFPDGFTPKGSSVENGCVEMPYHYMLEMVADWMGASMAYTGSDDMMDWLWKNMSKIRVHSKTAAALRDVLNSLGYADVVYLQKFAHEL